MSSYTPSYITMTINVDTNGRDCLEHYDVNDLLILCEYDNNSFSTQLIRQSFDVERTLHHPAYTKPDIPVEVTLNETANKILEEVTNTYNNKINPNIPATKEQILGYIVVANLFDHNKKNTLQDKVVSQALNAYLDLATAVISPNSPNSPNSPDLLKLFQRLLTEFSDSIYSKKSVKLKNGKCKLVDVRPR